MMEVTSKTSLFTELGRSEYPEPSISRKVQVEEFCRRVSYKRDPITYAISRFSISVKSIQGIDCYEVALEGIPFARYVFDLAEYYTGQRRSLGRLLQPGIARRYSVFIVSDRQLEEIHPAWVPVKLHPGCNLTGEYSFQLGGVLYSCDTEMANRLRTIIELTYSPDLPQITKVSYSLCSRRELQNLYLDLVIPGNLLTRNSSRLVYPGFWYFSPNSPDSDREYFCMWVDNILVGVIYYGMYGEAFGVSYIDIHQKYRGRGLATQLIKAFGECMTSPTGILELSSETELGARCHIVDKFHRYVRHIQVV